MGVCCSKHQTANSKPQATNRKSFTERLKPQTSNPITIRKSEFYSSTLLGRGGRGQRRGQRWWGRGGVTGKLGARTGGGWWGGQLEQREGGAQRGGGGAGKAASAGLGGDGTVAAVGEGGELEWREGRGR